MSLRAFSGGKAWPRSTRLVRSGSAAVCPFALSSLSLLEENRAASTQHVYYRLFFKRAHWPPRFHFLRGLRARFVLSQVISKADFIATVVNFDTDALTSAVIKTVEDVFKAAGDLTADAVTRASKACGPLYNVRYLLAVRAIRTAFFVRCLDTEYKCLCWLRGRSVAPFFSTCCCLELVSWSLC